MVVIYGNPADYEASKIIADALKDQLIQVTFENAEQIWKFITQFGGTYILVGGENANPITRRLVNLGLIEPLADPDKKGKAVIQYTEYQNAKIYVVAGWEKEETLWASKLIEAKKSLPDMKLYKAITGKKAMVWDVGYIPKIYQIEFTFVKIPLIDIGIWLRDTLVRKLQSEGYKVYLAKVIKTPALFGIAEHYILTIEIGEPVQRMAGIPPIVIVIIGLLATIGGVVIAWRVIDVWSRKEELSLAKIILESEVEYHRERLELLKAIQQLPPELRQEALKIIYERPSVLYQAIQKPTVFEEIRDIIKWSGFVVVAIIGAYALTKIASQRYQTAPAR